MDIPLFLRAFRVRLCGMDVLVDSLLDAVYLRMDTDVWKRLNEELDSALPVRRTLEETADDGL